MTQFTRVTEDILTRARKLDERNMRQINSVIVAIQATLEAGLNGRITMDQYHLLILADTDLLDLERAPAASAESQMKYLPIQHASTPCVLRAFALLLTHDFVGAKAQFEEAIGQAVENTEPVKLSDDEPRHMMTVAARIEVEGERRAAVRMRREAQAYLFNEAA